MNLRMLYKKYDNKILLKNRGSSYIEFIVVFLVTILAFYAAIQIFSLINAQILIINTARSTLREVEVYGKVSTALVLEVKETMKKLNRVDPDTISININGVEVVGGETYQLREPIDLKLSAGYNIFLPSGTQVFKSQFKISAGYQGSSQRLNKSLGDYSPVD